jgi:xanthine dehydrogenase accessory factor
VASSRKASVIKGRLLNSGADAAAVEAIVAPAGYPIAACTPEEIALSVLAALVAHRRGAPRSAEHQVVGTAEVVANLTSHVLTGLPEETKRASCCGSSAVAAQPTTDPLESAKSLGSCCGE